MDRRMIGQQLEDFNQFCAGVDIRSIVAMAEQCGEVPGYDKELYAIAILRAAHNGTFGNDCNSTQRAISALWERGYRCGFNPESFSAVFEEYFSCW